ncbi:thiamine-phosphate kinase [Psychromonas hadalis]|uniref:thiamine-phosphate kinase n=1 Tax=Psychromonas hadalis TaxID=211669 RepID=UPI0003B5CADA|nr:thiamine-phosphate kinase [Psychromonas hadalis]
MSLSEFDLIKRYFKVENKKNTDVVIGIGDDCAILDIPDGYQLAVTTDSLVAGIHFFDDVDPYRLGYKSLAVNLSDLAAMGALPKWVSLAITLPTVDEQWLSEFSRGFFALARRYNVTLVGGDTTKGPLSITVSAKGIVKRHKALLRSGAQVGDLICVSGLLGDGAVGLACKLNQLSLSNSKAFIDALELTEPRNELGLSLTAYASSCIDISDGLIQDLQHILTASNCSAIIEIEKLPLSSALQAEIASKTISAKEAVQYALTGGDDYELLFTLNRKNYQQFCLQKNTTPITVIGEIRAVTDVKLQLTENGHLVSLHLAGWDHFK